MTEEFSTPDVFGVRIGGLPVHMLDDLRAPELWQQTTVVQDAERRLDAAEAVLSDTLFAVIGRTADGKSSLVALRRAIHNRKTLPVRCWNDGVRALLPDEVADQVRAWQGLLGDLRRSLERLAELIAHHTDTRHTLLRKAVTDPAFRHGLVLSSPALHERLEKWLEHPQGTAPDRQLALRLAKYLARITTKTSPFSTFTMSGLGSWRDGDAADSAPGDPAEDVDPAGWFAVRSVAEINVWVVQQVVRQLSGHPALAAGLRLRLNPSAHLADGRWEFLGPGADEPLRGLPASAAVAACVEAVGGSGADPAITDSVPDPVADGSGAAVGGGTAGGRWPTRGEAVGRVAARTGSTPAVADAFLGKLVEVGLLETQRPFADQALDPLGELRTWVAGASPALDSLGDVLTELAALLEGYPALADPGERLRCARGVEAALRRVRELSGPGALELPAKNSIIENALLSTPLPGPDRTAWAGVLGDLNVVRRLYGVLDPALPGRIALAEAFAERIGAGAQVPFLAFHRAVQGWLREDQELPGLLSIATHGYAALAGHRLDRVRELARTRAELCAEVLAGLPDPDGVLRLDPARLSARAADWPGWMRAPDSVAFYGQPYGAAEDPRFVVNAVNSGHGRGRDRIRRLLVQAGTDVPLTTAPPPPGTILADTCRHFGSNVGLRLSAVGAEIDYPEGLSLREGGSRARVPLGDLVVRHDPELGLLTLRSARLDVEVRPVHPNLIAELWLPPAIRLLMQAFGATSNLLIPGRRMFGDPSLAAVDGMLAEPRVVIGRTTVSRRQWVFPVSSVPVRRRGEGDRELLLRLAGWLRGHGMPQRCFVRGLDPASVVGGSVWRIKSRKPLYVDFANLLLVGVFERMLTDDSHVLFLQEALPGTDELPHYAAAGARVTEFLLEINATYAQGS
ncbi:lantibiotic dehydratase [Streptomyces sp. NPDC021093]|uniref:lantibiotic dehydratase n=1 Tax=Streptomyces sp. NPDC021093 TaxID=3365112 RepID=UPI00379F1FDC